MNITLFQDKLGNYWKENKPSNGADHLQKNCNGTKTVEAVLECINNKTYSLGEAIRGMHVDLYFQLLTSKIDSAEQCLRKISDTVHNL